MPDNDTASLERVEKILQIIGAIAGLGVIAWQLWDINKDDPLGWPAQLSRRWSNAKLRRARARRERLDCLNWGVELALFLDREVASWRAQLA